MLLSPSSGVPKFSLISELGLGWMFLMIFWGRGLLQWFSNVFAWGRIALPLPGARLSNLLSFALRSFCSLNTFPTALEDGDENGGSQCPASRSRGLGTPLLNEPSKKSSQSLPSPWSLTALRHHPACDWVFLSLVHHPVWSLQTQQIPTAPSGGGMGKSPRICHLLGICLKSSGPTVPRITV